MRKLFLTLNLLIVSVIIFGQVELEQKFFFDSTLEINVPKNFKPMSKKMLDTKYPDRTKQPTLILTDTNGEVNLVIDNMQQSVTVNQIKDFTNFQMLPIKERPDVEWIDDGVKNVNGTKIGYSKFKSQAIDQKIFNYYFFISLHGKAILFNFNCIERLMPIWENTAEQIVNSIKIL